MPLYHILPGADSDRGLFLPLDKLPDFLRQANLPPFPNCDDALFMIGEQQTLTTP